ncbi:hypothetical protein LA6_002650 [Marinibacterium anthonyi]|nr:hypothetical protein LA6_002650 [Marinibacterium anthonyi]
MAALSKPPTGSIRPVKAEMNHARFLMYPSPKRTAATASPSAEFCTAIPMESGNPPDIPSAVSAMLDANPSGTLCTVTARTKNHARRSVSGLGGSERGCNRSQGILRFIWATSLNPRKTEKQTIAAGAAPYSNSPLAPSKPIKIMDTSIPASISTTATQSKVSRVSRDGTSPNKTGTAPTAVSVPAARLPIRPSSIGGRVSMSELVHPSG